MQTSPTERGRIYKCTTNNCQPIPLSVPVFAVNMSLGLTLTKDPASENTLACGPTLTRECRTINTYNGLCLKINSQNRAELQRPSILKDCPGLSDIAFLIDGSGSVAVRDFNATKVFVTRLVSSLRNGDTRFAITEYSGTPITYYHFDNFDLSKSLESKIPSISQQGEGTYTARAIEHVVTQVFSPTRGSRRSSKKVLIVITDGASLDFSNLDRAVNGAKAKGIVRFTIGVGRAFDQSGAKAELKKIASRPPKTHVFRVSNFDALDKIRDTLEESIFPIEGTQTGGSLIMEMAQEGFSAAFVPGGGFQMASVGAYDWSGGFRGYSSDGQLTFPQDEQFVEKDSYLGYSMAVAHTRSGPLTIVGAPRYLHRGVVFVYPKSLDISKGQMVDPSPWQSQIGEYFGAEIVTMAVNSTRQMFSKVVLIAAPLHMEEDWEGRVYVCQLTRVDCQFEEPVVLRGQAGEKGRFGSSMAPLPDLNQDGVYDLAVGAPLENQGQGSVYIFHGDMRGTINPRISQRIAGSDIQPGLQFFGLSISQSSSDLSGDGLPDLAVGSKGKVFLLRSKPIVMVEAQVTFTPAQIPPSPSDCLTPVNISAEVCFTMSGPPSVLQTVQAKINFTLSPDATRKRAYFTPNVRVRGESFTLNQRGRCFTYRVVIEPCPDDSLNDLYNELTFSFVGVPSTDDLSPSLSQQALTTSYHPLSFKINCENACADELKVGFNFSGSSAVRVGMDDLLNVTTSLTNLGGDSYNSQVVLTYPAGLSFRKFSTLQGRVECSSVDSENGLSLGLSSCWVYRPILKTNAKVRRRHHTDHPVNLPVLNFGRAFNVTVLIKVPVRLGGEHIWQEREDLQVADGDCSVASCLVFRCNMFMGRAQSNTFTINGNLSSGWITQIGIQSAKFLLISTATLEYDEDTYIFFSTESKHTPPIRKIVTEVEVYPVANFTKEIIGRTVGGLPLLAIIAVALYKAGFFKSHYKQMIKEAGTSGEGGEGGDGGGDGGGEGGGDGGEAP
uniref:VWFA domain-containing protein n=1 Tax=Gadus morhua TaxID=8049 RepID=A0A8C5BRW9_GADMO